MGGFVGHYWHDIHGDVANIENMVQNLPTMQKQIETLLSNAQQSINQLHVIEGKLTDSLGN